MFLCVLLEGRISEQQSLSLQCERSSRNVVSLCDRYRAIVLTCSALLFKLYMHKYSRNEAHLRLHTGINIHASIKTLAFSHVFANTHVKMDCSVTVATVQAAITVTGRTFN